MRLRTIDQFERRRRSLPHWEEPGATYFLTWTLRRPPVTDLSRARLAAVIVEALHRRHDRQYWLYDYVVMPDHVHVILKPIVRKGRTERLHDITRRLKSWTSREINRLLGRSGPLWRTETYDHILRGWDDYLEKSGYIYDNPHTAGLVPFGKEWPWWGRGPAGPE